MDSSDLRTLYQKYLDYYEGEATKNHGRYGFLKIGEITAAAAIPVVSLVVTSRVPAAVLGGVIAVVEGYLNLEKIHERWIGYRKAAEHLRLRA